ncbi:unnamed protein product [Phytomonas sp. Hart1]|nr:unnamed protein product [Phytomonas sp. Hart1]|eukprot:CCW71210.1 unnamed protein product [Phytomonas sp. isolate Hart1]
MYAIIFDSADSMSNSYFCLSQYLSRSSRESRKSEVTVSHSVAVWNEELLWRLINSLLSTLAIVHAAGFHYGGQITTEDIVCFAIPRQLSMHLENSLNYLWDKIGRNRWNADDIKLFIHTINSSIILPSAPIVSQTPIYRTFFTLTCIPCSAFSNPSNLSISERESCQQKDLNSVGKILLSIIEAQKVSNVSTETLVSSELEFFIKRMCGSFSSNSNTTDAPAVLYLTRLQALRLRANSWIHCLLAEETHVLACHYLRLHKAQGLSLYEDIKSGILTNLDVQQDGATLKENATHLSTYETEINAKAKLLEARENELSIREKKLEAILSLYELSYAHLDELPDAETAGYTELRRQLCGPLLEKDLRNEVKTDYTPSPNPMSSPRYEFTAHNDRTQDCFMEGNEVDNHNDTSSLFYHHLNNLSGKTSMDETSYRMIPQLSSEPHFSFSVPVDRTLLDKTNQTVAGEFSGNFPQKAAEVINRVEVNGKSTSHHQDLHSNLCSYQAASFYAITENDICFSSKGVEPCAEKLPSPNSSHSITAQQPTFNKIGNDCIPNMLPNTNDSALFFPPNTATSTPHTPPKKRMIPQEKPSNGSFLYSPPLSQIGNRLPSFQRSCKTIDDNSPCEAQTNGTSETEDTSKGCVGDFHVDNKCDIHCTPKHPVIGTLGKEDRSARSRYSTMLSNMRAECTDTSNSSTDIDTTPEHINQRKVLVPRLSGVLFDIQSFLVPEHAESKEGDNHLKTPCSGINSNRNLTARQSCRESRTTRGKTELDQDWIRLHYAELEEMQSNFRQDSAPGRNIISTRSARTTPRSFKVTRGGHPPGVSKECHSNHPKVSETPTDVGADANFILKRSTVQRKLEGHHEGRGRNIISPKIEVVTEETPRFVELSPNKPPASSQHHSSVTKLFISNPSRDVHEPTSQHSTSLTNSAFKLHDTASDSQIKQKISKEPVSASKMATPRHGASLFTPSTSSPLSLYVSEKYHSKDQQKGVKYQMDRHSHGTDTRKQASTISVTSKLTTPRRNLNSSSTPLPSSRALSSIHFPKHVDAYQQPQVPFPSPKHKVIGMQHLQSTPANASFHAVNQPRDNILNNISEIEYSNQRKIRCREHSLRAPSIENLTFRTPRNLEGGAQGISSRQGPPLKSVDISPNSTKFTNESLKGNTKSRAKTSSVDDAAQDLLKRLRNNVISAS